jgi:hypothetical protein
LFVVEGLRQNYNTTYQQQQQQQQLNNLNMNVTSFSPSNAYNALLNNTFSTQDYSLYQNQTFSVRKGKEETFSFSSFFSPQITLFFFLRLSPFPLFSSFQNDSFGRFNTATTVSQEARGPSGANLFVYNSTHSCSSLLSLSLTFPSLSVPLSVPENFSENDLTAMFATFGTVVSSRVYRDKVSGAPKGFGMLLTLLSVDLFFCFLNFLPSPFLSGRFCELHRFHFG